MSDVIGTYSFLPWLRHGVANSITAADNDPAVKLRATIPVELELTGQAVEGDGALTATITRDVGLYGPGDIVGIDPDIIIKTEPKHWITNFEPNYMAAIEFDPPDLLHRYTPAAPDGQHRLRPWLTLIVATEDEFQDGGVQGAPLDTITIQAPAATLFPPADQLWAWAHVHVNKDLVKAEEQTTLANDPAVMSRMESVLNNNSDDAYCRLLCPRRLTENVGYHAFLIPTFETGRLAGLGRDPGESANVFATMAAWDEYDDRPVGTVYPVYHRWYFKTGTVGDFEHLVRLLKPRPPNPRLGRRDMDVQTPGARLPGISDVELKGVLRLGGALKVPDEALSGPQEDEAETFEEWDDPYPHPFQRGLAQFINLAEDYAELPPETANASADGLEPEAQADEDPLITPPLYGRWPALTDRLLFEADGTDAPEQHNWIHELNLDPRFRVAAGFGTRVVQKNQEKYMDAAWGQVGDIIEANSRIRRAQLAQTTSLVWHGRDLGGVNAALGPARLMTLAAPIQRRAVADGLTLRAQVAQSTVPRAALSPTLRRILRPRDHISRRLGFEGPGGAPGLIEKINAGEVSAAPPKETHDTLPTVEDVAEELEPPLGGGALGDLIRRFPRLPLFVLVLALLLAVLLILFGLVAASAVLGAAGAALAGLLNQLRQLLQTSDAVLPGGNAPEVIDDLPGFPDFEIEEPGEGGTPGTGISDSPEATRFKGALKDVHRLTRFSADLGAIPVRPRLDLSLVANASLVALDPARTVPRFTLAGITIPARFVDQFEETFQEAMAYPEIDTPMYRPLLGLSDEHFLPNIDKIKPNTITLLETNQRFIEAYMVGLNHEFGRELRWREYPTDLRGSYFRQFWDVKQVMLEDDLSDEDRREALLDIPELHLWSKRSKLGEHDNREIAGTQRDNLVLCIRGDLLLKYPNAVIYMQKARWQTDDNGEIDTTVERELETEGALKDIVRTPVFEARVKPDIFFFGFELTAEEAQGGSGLGTDTDAGFMVVIEERPGESRFGLDISRDGDLNVWNDLSWPDVPLQDGFLRIDNSVGGLVDPTGDPELGEKLVQFADDQGVAWRAGMNAAEVAYILYQVPVRVGVHASEMLRK